jgi:transposase
MREYKLFGVDMTQIPGLLLIALRIYTEVGRDMSRWPTAPRFVSWLGLCPDNDISGGRVLWRGRRRAKNPAGQNLSPGSLLSTPRPNSPGNLPAPHESKLGPTAATTATAHKIAIIYYTMVKNQVEYDATLWAQRDTERESHLEGLRRKPRDEDARRAACGKTARPVR